LNLITGYAAAVLFSVKFQGISRTKLPASPVPHFNLQSAADFINQVS